MRRLFSLLFLSLFTLLTYAQAAADFDGTYESVADEVTLHLDLATNALVIPDYEFLGPVGGYIEGKGLYGVWMLTSHAIEGDTLLLRFCNDLGSDAQDITLTRNPDNTLRFEAIGTNNLRKAIGRKLVKIASRMILTPKPTPTPPCTEDLSK